MKDPDASQKEPFICVVLRLTGLTQTELANKLGWKRQRLNFAMRPESGFNVFHLNHLKNCLKLKKSDIETFIRAYLD